nr:uncharacterized protein C4orf22 homolog isoform X2 [Columba livia]
MSVLPRCPACNSTARGTPRASADWAGLGGTCGPLLGGTGRSVTTDAVAAGGMAAAAPPALSFRTYEEYLESQLTALDMYYLESEEVGRQLVELGFRGSGNVLQREEFEARALAAELTAVAPQKSLASVGKELKDNFLRALAEREEANCTGKISSIIFIHDRNSHRQEVSAYIDYAHRLTTDDFEVYFSGKKRLLPRNTDLRVHGRLLPYKSAPCGEVCCWHVRRCD